MSAKQTYKVLSMCPFLKPDKLVVRFMKQYDMGIIPKSTPLGTNLDLYWNEVSLNFIEPYSQF